MSKDLNLQQELKSETSSNHCLSLTDQDASIIKRAHEGRHSLRIQVEGLKQTVDVLNKELEEKHDQMKSCEASLRSEVIIPTKMTSLTKIQLSSDDRVSNASAEMERRESEDTGVSVNTASEQSKDTRDDDFDDNKQSKDLIQFS